MKRFIEGVDRDKSTLFPERLEDFITENNPVRVIEAFVEAPDLSALGCAAATAAFRQALERAVWPGPLSL